MNADKTEGVRSHGGQPAGRTAVRIAFCLVLLAASLVPSILSFGKNVPDAEKVQEMRVLAEMPHQWEGRAIDVDRNFVRFDRWFNDNMAFRSWMIRLKNQVDFAVFRSSSRVYFGDDREIYGRKLLDSQLPEAERLFGQPGAAERISTNLRAFSAQLRSEGVSLVLLTPMQRQNFSQRELPFFAPRLPEPSNFMKAYQVIKRTEGVNFVDVHALMLGLKDKYPLYFKQDFHWSDFSARAASIEIVAQISRLERRETPWRYPLETWVVPEVGTDARFSALLTEHPVDELRVDNRSWPAVHRIEYQDKAATGLEYVTDVVEDPGLLPSTCLYGNSFSDGMVSVGLLNHFQSFTRLDRDGELRKVPELVRGRCKYLVVQLLDISPVWSSLD